MLGDSESGRSAPLRTFENPPSALTLGFHLNLKPEPGKCSEIFPGIKQLHTTSHFQGVRVCDPALNNLY